MPGNSIQCPCRCTQGLGSTPQHLVRRWTIMLNVPVKNVIKEGQGISHMVWQVHLLTLPKWINHGIFYFFIFSFFLLPFFTFTAHLPLTCPYTRCPCSHLGMGIREDPGTFNGEGPQGHTCSRGMGSIRAGETKIIPKKDAPKSVLFIGVNNKSPGVIYCSFVWYATPGEIVSAAYVYVSFLIR